VCLSCLIAEMRSRADRSRRWSGSLGGDPDV